MFSLVKSAVVGALRRPLILVVPVALSLGTAVMMADQPGGAPAANPLASQQPAAVGGTLTVEQLGAALDSYGKSTMTNNGQTSYSITVPRGTWNINLIISISPNGKMIWMTNNLAALPDKLSADGLANVLKKNTEIGPSFFSISGGGLELSRPIANYELTAQDIHDNVEGMVSMVVGTAALWSTDALTAK